MSANQLSPIRIGYRLRVAREAAAITQAEAASLVGIARTTLVAIEKGDRRVRTSEIQSLARAYRTTVNTILRREAAFVELAPRFRKLPSSKETSCTEAADLLEGLVRAEVELEGLLGISRSFTYPPGRPLLGGDVIRQAEQDATELRHWLGLGSAPVRDMLTLLEFDLGFRVYIRPLASDVSGLFAFDDAFGACMLLNAHHPAERRNQTAAHEIGHFMSNRKAPAVMRAEGSRKSPDERYADAFGRTFLTPVRTVTRRFHEVTAGASRLTRQHVIVLARYFGVSREAIVRRLEEVALAREGTWDWFVDNGGITHQHTLEVPSHSYVESDVLDSRTRLTTLRIDLLASEVWRKELLSEGQLAELLRLDRVSLRELLDEVEDQRSVADGAPELPS